MSFDNAYGLCVCFCKTYATAFFLLTRGNCWFPLSKPLMTQLLPLTQRDVSECSPQMKMRLHIPSVAKNKATSCWRNLPLSLEDQLLNTALSSVLLSKVVTVVVVVLVVVVVIMRPHSVVQWAWKRLILGQEIGVSTHDLNPFLKYSDQSPPYTYII